MPVILVDDLVEGQVTESDYYSAKGQLLIAKGEIITDQHLSLLRRRNIFEIHLHYEERESDKNASHAAVRAASPGR